MNNSNPEMSDDASASSVTILATASERFMKISSENFSLIEVLEQCQKVK
jgi:hypothetical protein